MFKLNSYLPILISILLVGQSVCSQISKQPVLDSLMLQLQKAEHDTIKMDLYNKLRRATYYSDPKNSEKFTAKYLEMAEIVGDSLQIAIANFYMGNANVVNANPDKALPFYLKAANYFESKEDELSRLSSTYNGIASAYENNISDSLSLVYFEKSYQTSQLANDERRMGIALVNMSNIYNRNGELKKTISLLEKAVDLLQEPHSQIYLKPAEINLAAAYAENKDFEKAEQKYNQLLVEINPDEDVLNYGKALGNYGLLLQKKNDSENALIYLENAYDNFYTHGFMKERYNLMLPLIDAYYQTEKYKQATDLFYEYNTTKDSIYSDLKDKNLAEALQKFEAEKKDRTLLEQRLKLEKEGKQKNLLFYGFISTAIILIIVIVFYRQKLHYQRTITAQKESLQKQEIKELKQNNKLTALNSMIKGQEEERLRIAKDLHDSLGGLLSNVKSHFNSIENQFHDLESFPITKRTHQLVDEACLEVRRISHNMIPHALSISGLQATLEDLAENLRLDNYDVTLEIHNLPSNLDNTKQITLFRLIQEALSNIVKHAKATSILIQLFGYENRLHLIIEDNGKGFDYEKNKLKNGLGIDSINSRVEFLDGQIEWDSQLNLGTTITIHIPL